MKYFFLIYLFVIVGYAFVYIATAISPENSFAETELMQQNNRMYNCVLHSSYATFYQSYMTPIGINHLINLSQYLIITYINIVLFAAAVNNLSRKKKKKKKKKSKQE